VSANVRRNLAVQLVAGGDNPLRLRLIANPSIMPMKIGQTIAAGMLALVVQGGTGPYAFELPPDLPGSLPAGLSFDTSNASQGKVYIVGTIDPVADSSGTSNVGFHSFVAEVEDANGAIFTDGFSINVNHVLQWTQNSPSDGWHDEVYNYQFKAIGGTGTTTYSVVSGSVPTGLDLSTDGLLDDGAIGAASGANFTFTVRASDSGSGDFIDTVAHIHVYAELKPTIAFATVNLVVGTPVVITKSQAGILGGLAPFQGNPDPAFPLPTGLTAKVNQDGTVSLLASSAFTTSVIRFEYRDFLGQSSVSQSVHITASDPQQRFNAGDGATAVLNPNAITFDPATFDVTDDGSGGLHVVGLGGGDSGGGFGNQVITADDEFGNSVIDPAHLRIYSDDASVEVLGETDSSVGFSWRLRASGGGGPYLTGLPIGDSGGNFNAGDPFDFTPTLHNDGGSGTNRWELLNSTNSAWASIDSATGEITGTLPASGAVQLNIACTLLDGTLAGSSCFSRIPFSVTSSYWYAAIVAASANAMVFDVDDLSTLYTDTAHTTPATGVGDTIRAIFNKGPDGGYATSSSGMVLAFDAVLGKYYLQGPPAGTTGRNPFLFAYPSAFTGSPDLSIVVAAELYSTSDYQYLAQFGLDTDNGGSHGIVLLGNSNAAGTFVMLNLGSGGGIQLGSYLSGTHVFMGIADHSAPSYHIYQDGASLFGNFVTNYHNLSTQQLSLWDYYNSGAPCKRCFSIVIVDRVLTGSEITFAGSNAL
jgi:hypothetical protein